MTKQVTCELVREVGVDVAGVAVFAATRTRDVVFVSDEVAEDLDEMQFTLGEGPCLDAYRFHRPELQEDMAGAAVRARWPFFSPQAMTVGTASVLRTHSTTRRVPRSECSNSTAAHRSR